MRLELVTVRAGAFAMGSADGQPDEQPLHEVWLDEFALAVHPVTNREYRLFVEGHGPSRSGHVR
jgi:formylglycine-generating enzyme required for sulfatase activity